MLGAFAWSLHRVAGVWVGTLVWEPGVNEMSFSVPLIDNTTWGGTLEFTLELEKVGLVNGVLGAYLWQSRVKILDKESQ